MIDHNIFIHGGFDQEMPNIPTEKILCLDLNKVFNSVPALYKGLAYEIGKDIIIHNPGNNQNHPTVHNNSKSITNQRTVGTVGSGMIE